jgi:diguanylate cyclase (GGDEF)-like protein
MDFITGRMEEPILMFDELIVDAGRFSTENNPFEARRDDSEGLPKIPEVEIYEYRELVDQLAWLKLHYPDSSVIPGIELPMISGPAVITCDNTDFARTGNDADRMGVMFSVPFFDPNGVLKGSITAIIRLKAMRDMLPGPGFALVNRANKVILTASMSGQETISAAAVKQARPDSSLIYSQVISLPANDPRTTWRLWAGAPDQEFYNSPETRAGEYFELGGYGVAALLALAGSLCWALILRNMSLQQSVNATLEKRVVERTAEIHHMALHDALTGLPNRTMLRQELKKALQHVGSGGKLAVLWIDLDHFKNVNDSLGHPVGDALLCALAAGMLQCAGDLATVARVGGDEFVVLLHMISSGEQAANTAKLLIEDLSQPVIVEGHQVVVGASIGIAVADSVEHGVETLLTNADIALYRAKLDGRGTFRFFEPGMEAKVQERRQLEIDLRGALAGGEFLIHYQPLIMASTEQIIGFEALLRWNRAGQGLVSPAVFVPVAEEIGLIGEIGAWVLERACMDAMSWPARIKVAVNLSPVQFKAQGLGADIVKALDRSGLPPSRLELEITESVLLSATDTVLSLLHQLRAMGVKIAMDDFGTGYSSLSYLRAFPFDKIKIDRSFVAELGTSNSSLALINAIIAMGVSLGMSTTAEGVETVDQLEMVRRQGCTELQGFYFSRPVPQEQALAFLKTDWVAIA